MKYQILQTIIMVTKYFLYSLSLIYLTLSSVLAEGTTAQVKSVQEVSIKLNVTDATIKEIFSDIEGQTYYSFFYSKEIDNHTKVKLSTSTQSVGDILLEIAKQTNLEFRQVNKSISVKKGLKKEVEKVTVSIQPERAITGSVKDEAGEGLPGATIMLKGTSIGAVTDAMGDFSLNVPDDAETLVISYVGYSSKEVSIVGRARIDITLEADITSLNEVVIVGYGSQEKSDISGSIVSVSSESYENLPVTNVDNALQGRTPGLELTQTTGDPAAGMKIRIRGNNSINFSNGPLYVLDGVVIGDINVLNPNDIESMEILKDASATAIYGSRGANGVILITTKKGKEDSFNINFRGFYSVTNPGRTVDLLSPSEFAEQANTKNQALGANAIYSDAEIQALRNGGGTDWQDDALNHDVWNKNFNLSVSGGSSKTTYFVSANYLDKEGVVKNRTYDRYGLRANVASQMSDAVKIGTNISINRELVDGTLVQMDNALTFDPTTTYQESLNTSLGSPKSVGNINPNELIIADKTVYTADQRKIFANAYFEVNLLENLTWRTTGGTELYNGQNKTFTPSILPGSIAIRWFDGQNTRFNITNQLTYDLSLNDDHRLKVDAVQEYQKLKIETLNTNGSDLISEKLQENGLKYAKSITATPGGWEEMITSFMFRMNYSFKNKYSLTATGRYDGSSNFAPSDRWGFFPSIGASWVISEESFLQSVQSLDFLKLRASYGITGNQNVGNPNQLYTTFYSEFPGWGDVKADWPETSYSYPISNGVPIRGFVPTLTAGTNGLTWESNKQFDIGLDAEFFNSRFTASIDYYRKKSEDLILTRQLPSYAGVANITDNIGSIQNEGFEIALGVRSDASHALSWNVNGNISVNRNKVLDLGSIVDENGNLIPVERSLSLGSEFYPGSGGGVATILEVGKPLGQFYGYQFDGIYQSDEADEAAQYGLNPGDPRYVDIDGQNGIDANDKTIIGSANPDFTWGLTGGLTYKNFDLNIVIYGKVGGQIYNLSKGIRQGWFPETLQPVDRSILDRWTETNPSNTTSGYTATSANANKLLSSQYVEDASFTRIKDITLGYTIPEGIISKAKISQLRFYVSANNLVTLTGFKGYDPEISSQINPSNPSDIDQGIHATGLVPLPKAFIFGLVATF